MAEKIHNTNQQKIFLSIKNEKTILKLIVALNFLTLTHILNKNLLKIFKFIS